MKPPVAGSNLFNPPSVVPTQIPPELSRATLVTLSLLRLDRSAGE
jgi:hypothetical protein